MAGKTSLPGSASGGTGSLRRCSAWRDACPMRSAPRPTCAMNNYAGHRLPPWLGHIVVSRQETTRPLLTPGEVMQLPPGDELVLVSGVPPIRARKARYYEDLRSTERVLPPPAVGKGSGGVVSDDWSRLPAPVL